MAQAMRRNLIECKAVERPGTEHRQQLWNYMRLTNICIVDEKGRKKKGEGNILIHK